jgi:hypothetical protein
VACPYFYPTAKLEYRFWPHPWRLPLGGGFTGLCTAATKEFEPGDQALQEWCNLGYGRGRCPHFPDGSGPDAARFVVTADQDGLVRLQTVAERDHRPHECAALDFNCERGTFLVPPSNRVLARQAQVYVESYLQHKA